MIQPDATPSSETAIDAQPPADTEVPPTKTDPLPKAEPPTPTDTEPPSPQITFILIFIPKIPLDILSTNIVGIDILGPDHVMTRKTIPSWYDFGAYSEGSSRELAKHQDPEACGDCVYTLPPGKSVGDIIDIATTADRVLYYYRDGTVSVGGVNKADTYLGPTPFS